MADNTPPPTGAWPLVRSEVRSADGTVVAAHGSAPGTVSRSAPTVVLAGDLAEVVPDVWQPQVANLSDVRFLTWEYRGTGRARAGDATPSPRRVPVKRYDVAAHLEDLCAVVREAGIPEDAPFTMMGSGVGVRLAMEAALSMPQRVNGLVLIGGAAGWRYETLCRLSFAAARLARRAAEPKTKRLGARARHHGERALIAAVTKGVDRAMQLAEMSLLAPTSDDADNVFVTLDAVASTLRELGTSEVLEQAGRIQQPALVLCGEADPRMPSALAHMLARRIERSRVTIVPRTTSRLAFELPDLVNLELERFLRSLASA